MADIRKHLSAVNDLICASTGAQQKFLLSNDILSLADIAVFCMLSVIYMTPEGMHMCSRFLFFQLFLERERGGEGLISFFAFFILYSLLCCFVVLVMC